MARSAALTVALALCAANLVAGGATMAFWSQCGGTGGFFTTDGTDEAMYSCVDGSECLRQNEYWWECVPQKEVSPAPLFPCEPLPVVAAARDDLSSFMASVEEAGFLPLLTNVHGAISVYAPVNSAWEAATKDLSPVELAKVIQNHLAPGQVVDMSVATTGDKLYTALKGEELTVTRVGGSRKWSDETRVTLTTKGGVKAEVVDRDIQACRAALQVIDAVLLPEGL